MWPWCYAGVSCGAVLLCCTSQEQAELSVLIDLMHGIKEAEEVFIRRPIRRDWHNEGPCAYRICIGTSELRFATPTDSRQDDKAVRLERKVVAPQRPFRKP